ncbi:S9 family peptidase [Dysgonomonas sp. BGC7]|uniref:alpha/beta hydrolase family protein n=1 Tax=Dysgonomonas sp. BGC7 TaxID=1658008 RepID=UPI0006804DC1|nr:acetylxylan esterase [Dysgonomonas sp. BGC7]MBD8387282.1 acetylxylan esterase [Dysgonomonas sp. BGC7]
MKKQLRNIILCTLSLLITGAVKSQHAYPKVFSSKSSDKVALSLRELAKTKSCCHLITDTNKFEQNRDSLLQSIKSYTGVTFNRDLDLDMQITGTTSMNGFRIENIIFQSQPGIYVTANLYIPEGKGPFPAVVNMHGHWPDAKRTEITQTTAQLLAMNGYVCINLDAWGAGERGTNHEHEYHGSSLGASLLNIGKTLLGLQLTDNIRAVDLLCSLPYVQKQNIGATGASGGGNQTMWLSAVDNRIKAAVPVVSVGSFESYIMNSNCVCELLPHGLTFTEEDAVLSLIAPRALKILNGMNDANPSFSHIQMLKSYSGAKKVYESQNKSENIDYQLFNTGHGYWPEMQLAMLNWFNKNLKEAPSKNIRGLEEVKILPIETLATINEKNKDRIVTTEEYCKQRGRELKEKFKKEKKINAPSKRDQLRNILGVKDKEIRKLHTLSPELSWNKAIIETTEGKLIPILYKQPSEGKEYTIFCHPAGKDSIPQSLLDSNGSRGAILVDLWGTGENSSEEASRIDGALPAFHTLSRSYLWLGETIIGTWVEELQLVTEFATETLNAKTIQINAEKEGAIAALLCATLNLNSYSLILRHVPVSYIFDNRQHVDFYNMSVHIPRFLKWGDISLAVALSNSSVQISNPLSMSGRALSSTEKEQYAAEYKSIIAKTNSTTKYSIE